ncbi:MAG TPA: DoxX family protein [Gemmatimonadaceae bacterium]|nr:DoxX family protein [Gemmatimonadaceae bacterium]
MRTTETKRANRALWTIQALLAALFAFAGSMKLILPAAMLKGSFPLPVEFLRFIGTCELLGAFGLILPWLLRIRPVLTPLAASGLAIIMIGATVVTILGGSVAGATIPLAVGVLAGTVAYRRFALA